MVVRGLCHWRHRLLPQEFVLYSNLNLEKKLNHRHGLWVEFLQAYSFVLKHKSGVVNKAVDAVSCRVTLLCMMSVKVKGFESLKEDYELCLDFGEVYLALRDGQCLTADDYYLQDGYLFRANKLCISRASKQDILIWDIHAGGLSEHFGRDKTIEEVERQFYLSCLKRDCVDWSIWNMPIGQTQKAEYWPLHSPPSARLPLVG